MDDIKRILLILLVLFITSCYTTADRLKSAESVCNNCILLYRTDKNRTDVDEYFLFKDTLHNEIVFIEVYFNKNIGKVKRIKWKTE